MATYFNLDVVHYICSCGASKPLCRLYLCKHCFELRCQDCVLPEVDCQYCPNCLDYMSSGEAKVKKNRCHSCYDCPSCGHTLSTRATSAALPSPEDPSKQVTQKVYYMVCAFCRWATRDGGIPDQKVPSAQWRDLAQGSELRQDNSKRLSALTEAFRQLALKEKAEKDRKKIAVRKKSYFTPSFAHAGDRYGLASVAMRKKSAANPSHFTFKLVPAYEEADSRQLQSVSLPASEAQADPDDDLDESYWLGEAAPAAQGLHARTTLQQRLCDPELQPELSSRLAPVNKAVLCKRSLRCRQCEHNLSKPELNAASTKFKINLCAVAQVPELRVHSVQPLVLCVANPAPKPTPVTLESLDGRLRLPASELTVGPKDEAAEFDEAAGAAGAGDKAEEVAFRSQNRLGVRAELLCSAADAADGLRLRLGFDFRNVVLPTAADSVEIKRLSAQILVRLPAPV